MTAFLSRRFSLLVCLAVIVAVALWFRVYGLTANPLWLDEAYSAYAADKGFGFIFKTLPSYETHPPFYSAVLSGWTDIFGNTLAGFRTLGLVAGLLLFPLCWWAAREVGRVLELDPWFVGLAALGLLAVLPPIIYITQLVRPYALMAVAYLIGTGCVLVLARRYKENGRLQTAPWIGYLASLVLLVWLHNLGLLYASALGLVLLILIGPLRLMSEQPRTFLVGHVIAALAALPALLILLDQAPTWQKSTWLRFHWDGIGESLYTIYGLSGLTAFAIAAFIIVNAVLQSDKSKRRLWLALLTLTFVPILLSIAISALIAPVFLSRTLAPLSIGFILLVAAAGASPSLFNRAGFATLLFLTTLHMIGFQQLKQPENWYGAVAWLKGRIAPGDVIYAYPNEGALPLSYALRDKGISLPIRPIPGAVPAKDPTGWFPTGSRGVVSLPQYRLDQIAGDAQSRKIKTIWLLRLGASTYDRDDGFLNALMRDREDIGSWEQDPIDIIGLRQTAPASVQIAPRQQPQP